MRLIGLACLLALAACASDDGPADVTVEGVDPLQTDADLAPESELSPGSQVAPAPRVAPEPTLQPEPTL